MKRRFTSWAIVTLVVLGLSSAVGLVVNSAIDTKPRSHYSNNYTPPVSNTTIRYDLKAGLQTFNSREQPTADESGPYVTAITNAIANHAKLQGGPGSYNYAFTQCFHVPRMAEEWVRFGAFTLRGTSATYSAISLDESTIQAELNNLAQRPEAALQPSKVTIESLSRDSRSTDVLVLAKHTGKVNGVLATWHTRWWLAQQYGQWKVYDFEVHPSRLRWNAVAAAWDQTKPNSPTGSLGAPQQKALQDLVALADRAMTEGVFEQHTLDHKLQTFKFVTPLDSLRKAFAKPKTNAKTDAAMAIAKKLQTDVAVWPDTPVTQLMQLNALDNAALLAAFRTKYGPHTWADVIEATTLAKSGKLSMAKALLEKALTANPGQPLLLTALFPLTKTADEWKSLGEQAALGQAPTIAIRELFVRHGTDAKGIVAVVDAFCAIRPEDPEACLARGVLLAADAEDMKAAAIQLKLAFANSDAAEHPGMIQRFHKAYYARTLDRDTAPEIEKDPDLGPLLNKK